jgi:hypothetical protein
MPKEERISLKAPILRQQGFFLKLPLSKLKNLENVLINPNYENDINNTKL